MAQPGYSRAAIAVMAKAPRPGQVKTRLVPPLSPDEATTLNAAFLRDISETVAALGRSVPLDSFVAYAPAGEEARFDGLLAPGTKLVLADGAGAPPGIVGIGASLWQAFTTLFGRGYDRVCLVNADSPNLPGAFLAEALDALARGQDGVLGPAEDGGYYLIGLPTAAVAAALLRDIPWSTAAVTRTTLTRAAAAGLTLHRLPVWYDVDQPTILARLADDLAADPAAAPATAAALTALGRARSGAA